LREEVNEALKAAMKSRDAARVSTLRMIAAAFKDRDILGRTQGSPTASDEELLSTLAKMVKQREESATAFEGGGRPELAAKERAEIEVIRGFMPKQMGEDEVRAAIEAAIGATGAASLKDMGKVMGYLKEHYAGKLDFSKAGAIVKGRLG
jgi:uncharacterized protein YqeY